MEPFTLDAFQRRMHHYMHLYMWLVWKHFYQLSSRKVDAQSVTNWAIVGQLSWQYPSELRRSTTVVYCTHRQALSTARFCRAGQSATADTCHICRRRRRRRRPVAATTTTTRFFASSAARSTWRCCEWNSVSWTACASTWGGTPTTRPARCSARCSTWSNRSVETSSALCTPGELLCPNSTRWARPDYVGDPGRRNEYPLGPRGFPTSPRTLSGQVRSGPCPCSGIWHGPDQTLSLVGSGRIVSKFRYTDRTGPDTFAPATRSLTKSGPCQISLHGPTDPRTLSATRPDQTRRYVLRLSGKVYNQTKSADLSETQAVRGSGLVGSV